MTLMEKVLALLRGEAIPAQPKKAPASSEAEAARKKARAGKTIDYGSYWMTYDRDGNPEGRGTWNKCFGGDSGLLR